MPRRKDVDILVAIDSGVWVDQNGTEYPFFKGMTRVRASHPLAKAFPTAFKPIDVHYDVEQATAAPGERRGQ